MTKMSSPEQPKVRHPPTQATGPLPFCAAILSGLKARHGAPERVRVESGESPLFEV